MNPLAQQTLASIVTENHQSVTVLEKHHLDFCCKGKRTLTDACMEKGLSVEQLLQELNEVKGTEISTALPFTEMNGEQLINYILIHHHHYVKEIMPVIAGHLEKVANKHGERYPYMIKVFQLFNAILEEMTLHMHKEEVILFPRIKEMEQLFILDQKTKLAPGYIKGPVNIMEAEHEHAGELLYEIRQLTDNFTPPVDACTTFKVCLEELKAFEIDLHKHVHLENYLLFPLAEKIMENIRA